VTRSTTRTAEHRTRGAQTKHKHTHSNQTQQFNIRSINYVALTVAHIKAVPVIFRMSSASLRVVESSDGSESAWSSLERTLLLLGRRLTILPFTYPRIERAHKETKTIPVQLPPSSTDGRDNEQTKVDTWNKCRDVTREKLPMFRSAGNRFAGSYRIRHLYGAFRFCPEAIAGSLCKGVAESSTFSVQTNAGTFSERNWYTKFGLYRTTCNARPSSWGRMEGSARFTA
jgi:hypothetical protein